MMLKVWKWYQNCLAVHPVKTQAISSAILWVLSDSRIVWCYVNIYSKPVMLKCQRTWFGFPITCVLSWFAFLKDSDAKFTINWNRLAVTSMFGFGFVGPVGHFWCVPVKCFLDSAFLSCLEQQKGAPLKKWDAVIFKVAGIHSKKNLFGVNVIMGIAKSSFVLLFAIYLDKFGRRQLGSCPCLGWAWAPKFLKSQVRGIFFLQ
ncbi:hypothetical protein JHK85_020841 [Glycine max]|nr:hypothetical protein JHK85_020841 [Glycine max]